MLFWNKYIMMDNFSSRITVFDNAPTVLIATNASDQSIKMNNYMINILGYSLFDDVRKMKKNGRRPVCHRRIK